MHCTDRNLDRIIESRRVLNFGLVDSALDRHCHLTAKIRQCNLLALFVIEMRGFILHYRLKQTARLAQDNEPAPFRDTDIMNHTAHGKRITRLAVVNRYTRCFMLC